MKLGKWLGGFGRDKSTPETAPTSSGEPTAARPAPAAPAAPVAPPPVAVPAANAEPPRAAAASATSEPTPSITEVADMFRTIQSVLDSDTSTVVGVPCSALLSRLPEALRGPEWRATDFPSRRLELDREQVLAQLREGRVCFPLGQFLRDLPPGWVVPDRDAVVELDLPQVVEAMPPEALRVTVPRSVVMDDAEGMRDVFTAKRPVAGASDGTPVAAAVVVPELPVPATPEPPAPRKTPPAKAPAAPIPASSIPVFAIDEAVEAEGASAGRGNAGAADTVSAEMHENLRALASIESILEPSLAGVMAVPCAALLAALPERLRGPAWKAGDFPAATLPLERAQVLAQLQTGRVSCRLGQVLAALPAGWVVGSSDEMVDLDLAQVVAAVPPDLLRGAAEKSRAYAEAETMQDVFARRSDAAATPETKPAPAVAVAPAVSPPPSPAAVPAAPVPAATVPSVVAAAPVPAEPALVTTPTPAAVVEPEPIAPAAGPATSVVAVVPDADTPPPVALVAPTAAPEAAPVAELLLPETPARTYAPVDWDGIEHTLATAACGVDINSATVDELTGIPGVGSRRARDIIAHREAHGAFTSIYGLASVPGIGGRLFRQMTGLSLTTGTDRHQVLLSLVGMAPQSRPSLTVLLGAIRQELGAAGCLLASVDGMPLAFTSEIADSAALYAAVSAQLFRRTGRYLSSLAGGDVSCVSLPMIDPPLLVFGADAFFLVVAETKRSHTYKNTRRAQTIFEELAWLLGLRAVVTAL